jgi:uncharacterized protein (DUF736 family)
MAYDQREGQGSLFKNEDRETEQHPHYRGSITIGGQQYWLSAWLKEGKNGKKFMSLSAQPKKAPVQKVAPKVEEKFEDDIPW